MADYDRNFYSRKGNKRLKFFLLLAMFLLLCYGLNLCSETFYDMPIWEAFEKLQEK